MAERIALETFRQNLNTKFRVSLDGSPTLDIELFKITEGPSTPGQEQFSLRFYGPLENPFQQGTREVQHEKLGTLDLFLVPMGREPEGMIYEAYFNRFVEQDKD